jgi:cytochrome c-type biogenesis protein CcsB
MWASILSSLPFLGVIGIVFQRKVADAALKRARQLYVLALGLGGLCSGMMIATQSVLSYEVNHAPFQTIYEIFLYGSLCMALCFLIISFTNRLHDSGRGGLAVGGALGFLTFVVVAAVLGPVMTAYGYDPLDLPPALQSSYFIPHVMVYIFGYGAAIVAALAAATYLLIYYTRLKDRFGGDEVILHLDTFAYRNVALAFPFLTLGLVLGTIWAWYAWANYWGWDNKEVWALITWLIFLIYLHLRLVAGWRGPRSSWFIVVGGICVIITLLLFGYLPASYFSVHKYSM